MTTMVSNLPFDNSVDAEFHDAARPTARTASLTNNADFFLHSLIAVPTLSLYSQVVSSLPRVVT
jgi:hypothetical protein